MNVIADYVIVGGGISGLCIVQELDELMDFEGLSGPRSSADQNQENKIIFVTGHGGFVKRVTNIKQFGQITASFDVKSEKSQNLFQGSKRIRTIQDDVNLWKPSEKVVCLKNGTKIHYGKLAIATGAVPKRTFNSYSNNVIRIRDTQTIAELQNKLKGARRILIIGNGGIASELAFELKNIEIVWAIRHGSISATYFDVAAAKFFTSKLASGRTEDDEKFEVKMDKFTRIYQHQEQTDHEDDEELDFTGSALGPYWLAKLAQQSSNPENSRKVHVITEVELNGISEERPSDDTNFLVLPDSFFPNSSDWRLWALLNNGKLLGCDLIIEATGVIPNSNIWKQSCPELLLADDGIAVDDHMRTNITDVFAAGDVCTAKWAEKPHWKQIRLWTQARQMGIYCARCMFIKDLLPDITFELFSHITTFFGYKVVLLGDFAAEKQEKPFEINYRITEGREYVKVITKNHRIQGAVLIGESELEETIENLILNQTDISQIEDNFLDPDVDLEDYFD